MEESTLHNLIINNSVVQHYILSLLNLPFSNYSFIHEDTYINGITADFTIKQNDLVYAIMECKGSNIGVNEYVRGIGQLLQYQYFIENSLSKKSYSFDKNAKSIYLFPSSIIKNKSFNIGLFKYPNNSLIFEINEYNYNVREITHNEMDVFKYASNNDLVTVSQYYIRDNRLFEIYILLQYLNIQKIKGIKSIDRKSTEINFLRKLNTPNTNNWRNAFITLSSFGFIDSNNMPTNIGQVYSNFDFPKFAYELFENYLKPYFSIFFSVFDKIQSIDFTLSNLEIADMIRKDFNGKNVLFVTDSDQRYISSWMNIFRDDYNCIDFKPRNNHRRIIYNPLNLNKNSIISNINNSYVALNNILNFKGVLNQCIQI